MKEEIIELFLRQHGTQQKAAEFLKISQSHFNKIRSGERNICPDKAKKITQHLCINSNKKFSPDQLISSIEQKKQKLDNCSLSYVIPIKLCPFNLDFIKTSFDENHYQRNKKLSHDEVIIIDEFNYLISGEETYFYYLGLNKKTTKVCQVYLQKLVNLGLEQFIIACIYDVFNIAERTKLAQRVENLVGNRRGKLSKKCLNVENSPHLVLPKGVKTREFVALLFSIGSDHTYRTLKKIIAHNDKELIKQILCEKITPHAAYQQILDTKLKPSFSFCSLFNH